jgi:hypothetical protein
MGYVVNPANGSCEHENPRSIAGGTSGTISFNASNLNSNGVAPEGDALYIHIALSGEIACDPNDLGDPDIKLKVYVRIGTTMVEGNLVVLGPSSGPENLYITKDSSLFDTNHLLGVATMTEISHPDRTFSNVFQVKISDINATAYGWIDQWEIQILNTAPGAVRVVWVVAGNEVDAGQPWLDVSSEPDFNAIGTILTGKSSSNTLTIANRGTGPLGITGLDFQPGDGYFSSSESFPKTIPASDCGDISVQFNAQTEPDTYEDNVSLVSNDSLAVSNPATLHNKQVALSATCVTLEIVMVLDASGSMALTPDGSALAANEADMRWGSLREAANQFLALLSDFSEGAGRIGIVRFPDINDPVRFSTPTSEVLLSSAPIVAPIDTIEEGSTPSGLTPMGHGIQTAFGEFQDETNNRRWMVIMSDGAHNLGPPHPDDYSGTNGDSFQGNNIHVFAVAYGDAGEGGSWPPHEQMQRLAEAGFGDDDQYWVAGENDVDSLSEGFRAAIVTGLALGSITDPLGVLTPGRPELRHSVNILPYDTQVTFVVNWSRHDQERVDVRLLTPLCEMITPDLAAHEAKIQYHGNSRYAIYTFQQDYLRNASDPERPRYGPWTLVVTGNGLEEDDREAYTYEVITRSDLKMRPRFDQRRYWAGDPVTVSVRLLLNGKPIPDATVSMHVEAPGEAAQNWMARQKVSPKEFKRAKEQLEGKDVTALDIKAFAVLQQGQKFEPSARNQKVIMTDPSRQGVYSATFTRTTVPGNYKFHITAVGQTPDCLLFNRERQVHQFLDVRPEAGATFYHADCRKIVDDNKESLQTHIRVWPRDRSNNVVLSPGDIHGRIVLTVEDGKLIDPLKDNLDGSYSAVFRCDVDAQPSIGLKVYGHQVFDKQKLLPVAGLHYADQVLEYKPGRTAQGEDVPHDDPEAALGDATLKDDEFVHLGINGSLTLGIKDQAVYAGKGDDVAVFVQPAEDRCDYRVEVLPMGPGAQWTVLGTSPGVTRAFGLGAAGIRAVKAIRVVDRSDCREPGASGRVHGAGVAVRGMGFGKVGPLFEKNDGCLAWPLALIRKLTGSDR